MFPPAGGCFPGVQCGQSDASAASTAAKGPTADLSEQPAAASLLPDAAGHLSRTLSPQCAPFSPIPYAGDNPTKNDTCHLEGNYPLQETGRSRPLLLQTLY